MLGSAVPAPAPGTELSHGAELVIGGFRLAGRVLAAPMAGVTDRPYRRLCRSLGASYAVGEMAASNPRLWASEKTMRRLDHQGEPGPVAVQLAGSDPAMLAEAARFNAERGAQIIDINMGCPAKKVLRTACGSALLRDEALVARILDAVVAAVRPLGVPVTLKTRTGWDSTHRDHGSALRIARLAENCGIAALVLHGRTRACGFGGHAEYQTIAAVKAAVSIPVIANGDIDTPAKAQAVLAATGADGVMVGRAALGRPWLFGQIDAFLANGELRAAPSLATLRPRLQEHLYDHYAFYGRELGVRTARKHVQAYLQALWPDAPVPADEVADMAASTTTMGGSAPRAPGLTPVAAADEAKHLGESGYHAAWQRLSRIDDCDAQARALDDLICRLLEVEKLAA